MRRGDVIYMDIFKYDPIYDSRAAYVSYEVPYRENMSVLDCLEYINENHEPLVFQRDCRRYICGSCTVKLNNVPILACKRKISISEINHRFKVEPLTCLPLIKDLMVDFGEDMRRRERLRPSPEFLKPISSLPLKLEKIQFEQQKPYALCVRCYACVEVCPAAKKTKGRFSPLTMQEMARLMVDKRDEANRFSQAMKEGLLECKDCNQVCNQVCPAGLDVYGISVGKFIL